MRIPRWLITFKVTIFRLVARMDADLGSQEKARMTETVPSMKPKSKMIHPTPRTLPLEGPRNSRNVFGISCRTPATPDHRDK